MQAKAAFVVEVFKTANQVQARALLGQPQGHDLGLLALASGVLVVQLQPAVGVQRLAHLFQHAGAMVGGSSG